MTFAWLASSVRQQVRAHRWAVFAASAAFCLVVLIAGGASLGARTVSRWGAFMGQNVHVIVYLDDEFDGKQARELAELLRRIPTVAQVATVEPAEAMARLGASAAAFAADSKALDGLDPSYFPRSLEVGLIPAADLGARANDLTKRLRGVPGVLQADTISTGIGRLPVWVRVGQRLGYIVLFALALVAFGTLAGAFLLGRGAVARRAAVLVQLGETASGIRLPSSLWMAAAAAAGGGTGALALVLGWQPLITRLERILGIATNAPLPFFGHGEIATGFAVVVLVGLAMGYFAVPLRRNQGHA